MNQGDVLWTALVHPAAAVAFTADQWDWLVRQARGAKVLGRLAFLLDEQKLLDRVPAAPREHLTAARAVADRHACGLRWETTCLASVLRSRGVEAVLLKGAAYLAAGLPPAHGRLYGDIDLMVPKASLSEIEQILLKQGWEPLVLHPYDQRYYRHWMHELPPLVHTTRRMVLDLHHTILPETGRLHPDPQKLLAAARPVGEGPLRVLAPADMILHSAAHLFQDGDLAGGIRDLTDLDDLLRHFSTQPEFWDHLVPRARDLDLARPLYYALRSTSRFLQTPIPEPVVAAASLQGPRRPLRGVMDFLVSSALTPGPPDKTRHAASFAHWLLYVRSHWLRMPPRLLFVHLARKAMRRWYDDTPKQADQPVLPDADDAGDAQAGSRGK